MFSFASFLKKKPKFEEIYLLHHDGVTGYHFTSDGRLRKRYKGTESNIQPHTEDMGKANDSLTGNTLGYGIGEQGTRITKEEYSKL